MTPNVYVILYLHSVKQQTINRLNINFCLNFAEVQYTKDSFYYTDDNNKCLKPLIQQTLNIVTPFEDNLSRELIGISEMRQLV